MKENLKKIGLGLLSIVLMATAFMLFRVGFMQLSDVRQIDRLPITPTSALTNGMYYVRGTIADTGTTIIAPYSKDAVIYYRYLLEEETVDSDGDRTTRTIEQGESATIFTLNDFTGVVTVNPGRNLSSVKWQAVETYRHEIGNLTYTEYTLRSDNLIEMLAWYESTTQQIELSGQTFPLKPVVTSGHLKTVGGQTLFLASLLISLAAGLLAMGLAGALILLGVHRYWVFVVAMTVGLMASLWSLGLYHLQQDWQTAAALFNTRAERVDASSQLDVKKDLYAYYVLIERSAQQWPDTTLFKLVGSQAFSVPVLNDTIKSDVRRHMAEMKTSRFETTWLVYGFVIVSGLGTIGLIIGALKSIRFKRLIEFLPTSNTTGLSYGLSELSGLIEVDTRVAPMESHINQHACVAYEYKIEEKRGTGKKSKWVTLESGKDATPFLLSDTFGQVSIHPEGANIVFPEKTVSRQGRKRFTESWLPPGRSMYCLGFAGIADEQSNRLTIQKSEDVEFLITTQNEETVVKNRGFRGFMLTGMALGFSLISGTVWLAGGGSLTPLDLIKVSLIVPILLSITTLTLHYNGLVFLKNRVDKTRADIDTLLQRRHDLWPQLISTVTGYLEHEQGVLLALTETRTLRSSITDEPERIEQQVKQEHQTVARLMATIERYPALKANRLVQNFSQQMHRTEDELALIRQGYNDSVELYNTQIQKLPDVFLAKLFGFRKSALFVHQDD